jgi:hypothetical protein
VWSQSAWGFFRRWVPALWEATFIPAVLLPTTITLLSDLHHTIPTDGSLWFCNPKLFMNIYIKYSTLSGYQNYDPLFVSYSAELHKFKK